MSDLLAAARLAETMCARICHDLGGPMGTVDTCLELMAEGQTDAETMAAAAAAMEVMQARLRLLRAAWGPHPGPLTLTALHDLTAGLPNARKLTLETDRLPANGAFAPRFGRALAAVLLLAGQSLPGGGQIVLFGTHEDVLVRIAGPHAAWPEGLALALREDAALDPILDEPRQLALPMAVLVARAQGLRLSLLLPVGGGTEPAPLRLSAIA